jgi:hypothetical protein
MAPSETVMAPNSERRRKLREGGKKKTRPAERKKKEREKEKEKEKKDERENIIV